MHSLHRIYFSDSRRMGALTNESIDLIVTSPPYPMIEMWDSVFAEQDSEIRKAMKDGDPWKAFERMHGILDGIWEESFRVLKKGGLACINIGDAVRTLNGDFTLYPNHSRILSALHKVGFVPLPCILWRKQTNAPNKFMGSGMLPPGAYVTLEHEYILIVRKGGIRPFQTDPGKEQRCGSAFFWEERNIWFSDVWMDLKGASQEIIGPNTRNRSAAFPFELPYRLISMYSVKGDTVLDPFLGTGTTLLAAMASGRNGIGYETDDHFENTIFSKISGIKTLANHRISERLQNHLRFAEARNQEGKPLKHYNLHYEFPVMTRQETRLILNEVISQSKTGSNAFEVTYADKPQHLDAVCRGMEHPESEDKTLNPMASGTRRIQVHRQGSLF